MNAPKRAKPPLDSALKASTLTKIREAERQSKAAFSERLGVSRNSLAAYESGKRPIPIYIALAATCIYRRMDAME